MIDNEEEVLNINLLLTWFKIGAKVNVSKGKNKGDYGFIEKMFFESSVDDIVRAEVYVPGTGNIVYKVNNLMKFKS